jgi:hypothetical protein
MKFLEVLISHKAWPLLDKDDSKILRGQQGSMTSVRRRPSRNLQTNFNSCCVCIAIQRAAVQVSTVYWTQQAWIRVNGLGLINFLPFFRSQFMALRIGMLAVSYCAVVGSTDFHAMRAEPISASQGLLSVRCSSAACAVTCHIALLKHVGMDFGQDKHVVNDERCQVE